MKRCLCLLLTFLMIFSLTACGDGDVAPETPVVEEIPIAELDLSDVIAQAESAVFNTRLEDLLDLIHPNVLTALLTTAELSQEDLDQMIAELNTDLAGALTLFHMLDGSYELTVVSERALEADELDALRDVYSPCMVDVRAATAVEVEFKLFTAGKQSYAETIEFTMIEIAGQWYIDAFGLIDHLGLEL